MRTSRALFAARLAVLSEKPSSARVRTHLAVSKSMPRNFEQAVYFMLGLLLAFYVLLPFLGVDV